MIPVNILRYGNPEPLPIPHALRAGPITLSYAAGDLRYLRLGDREVLRRVYVAVRDADWGTVAPQMANERITASNDSFQISYQMTHQQGAIDFVWQAEIHGAADGTITWVMDGAARSTFRSNRIGFCVLHPAAAAGSAAVVGHVDGSTEAAVFPKLIAPQLIYNGQIQPVQPFAELRALTHEIAPGVWAAMRFDGDIFELEDQRNWLDGSYKTYSRPLRLPFPYEVAAGTKLRQLVTLQLQPAARSYPALQFAGHAAPDVSFNIGRSSLGSFPAIGLGVASHNQPLSAREIERLRVLRPAHLRVDLMVQEPGYVEQLRRAAAEGRAIDAPLEVALFLSGNADAELSALLAACHTIKPVVARWLVFHNQEPTTAWVRRARAQLVPYAPDATFAAGTNLYFTDLNRERPDTTGLDHLVYSINPQVHAFDNASLIETAATIMATVESARAFSGAAQIISPITLKPRFNPAATGREPDPAPGMLPPQVDVRQMSLVGACWTLTSLRYLAESAVASATYYETSGWRGVMETEAGSPLPERFASLPGGVFPLYHVLADVGACAGSSLRETQSSDTLVVDGFALACGDTTRVLLANLTNTPQHVHVSGLAGQVRVRLLDEHNAQAAMQHPESFRASAGIEQATEGSILALTLAPYAVARIDSIGEADHGSASCKR